MATEKKPETLTQFIYDQTKDFLKRFEETYSQPKRLYFRKMYDQLANCYTTNITEQTVKTLNSQNMLAYFTCYKKILRVTKNNNKKLYQEGLDYQKKLKQCLEIKSVLSQDQTNFDENRIQCLQNYKVKYETLYQQMFKDFLPVKKSETKPQKIEKSVKK